MDYLDVINLVFLCIYIVFGVLSAHSLLFMIVGLFFKKKFPKAKKIRKLGIIIPARNEEKVVGGLIESVYKNDYPQDKLEIFVIAHNCSDKTAEVARRLGAKVYEYNNENECTMGYAFRYLFSQIEKDYGTASFDGFVLFNADNILKSDFFSKMNDAYEYYKEECVITSFRNSKNWGSNLMSSLYGIFFASNCRFESRGRTVLGCSTRVQGTGYLINSKLVKNGWPYVTLTEDWEFSANEIINNNKIRYCDEAEFYDEQPTTFKVMWRQRVRWARGHLLVFKEKGAELIKNIFSVKNARKNKFSLYDIFINVMPMCLILTTIGLLQAILTLIAPIFTERTFLDVLLIWIRNVALGALVTYLLGLIPSILIYIVEGKRIKNVTLGLKILSIFMWPLFTFIQFAIEYQALFSKNLGWKVIPHSDQTTFDKLNSNKNLEVIRN